MKNKFSIIMSVIAIVIAGSTWFRNSAQSPIAYSQLAPPERNISVDTAIFRPDQSEYHVWKVLYLRPVPHTIKAPGLPTYDSIMIDMPFSRYVLQGGIDFNPSLFLEYTYGASRVVDWTLIR